MGGAFRSVIVQCTHTIRGLYGTEDHTPEKLAQFREMAQLVLLLLARSKFNADGKSVEQLGDELMDRVVRLFCRVNCNAFTICDDTNAPVGIGLFPRGALFNHSCAPNCIVSFRGREMVVHTLRDLEPGEELTVDMHGLSAGVRALQL